jgi:dihydrofolate reductase
MGRLVYGMMQSLDGYIADERGDITLPVPGPELHRYFNDVMRTVTLSVYGRRMWEVMRYWAEPDPDRGEVGDEFAQEWGSTPIVVISRTLREVPPGVTLISTDAVEAVRTLKAEVDGDIEVSGAELAGSLGAAGLIDEYRLYYQPVVLGSGTPYFASGFRPDLRVAGVESLPEDVTLVRCVPAV